jgi:branched-chain amino acid transport system substrate-binding protein
MQGYKRGDINPIAVLAMDAGFISPSFLKTLGADGNFIFTREVWALDIGEKKAIVKRVNDAFKKRFQRGMSGNSARSFTAMFVVANAIQHAGKTSPDAVRQALMDTSLPAASIIMPWDGVRFDPQSGQNILGKGIIVQIQKGEYRTVWPRELSGSHIVWPMPGWKRRR